MDRADGIGLSATISLTQSQIFVALGSVLQTFGLVSSVPGQAVDIIRGQVNRVPEPASVDFVVLWPLSRARLAMNVDTLSDNQITGSITNNVLTVTAVAQGFVAPGQSVFGTSIATPCQIICQTSGATGGIGTYSTTPTANVASGTLFCGTVAAMQETEVTIQADVHGPASADNAARIQTLFRDQFGVSAFLSTGIALAPLYTSDPRQTPFDNGEQQVEERWSIDLCMQANVTVTTPMQFADELTMTTTRADAPA